MTNRYIQYLTSQIPRYETEVEWLLNSVRNSATYTDGVMLWNVNGNVPPEDVVEFAAHVGMPVDIAKCTHLRDVQTKEALDAYSKARSDREFLPEELAELRSVHGAGAVVVDALTGKSVKL